MQQKALVLVVNFGAQYAQLIARRVRDAHIYSELVSCDLSVAEILAKKPVAIILSGGPESVYSEGSPKIAKELFDSGVPILGICYGFQLMAQALGGQVAKTGLREYGAVEVTGTNFFSELFVDIPVRQETWMSHGDCVEKSPEGFTVLATSVGSKVAAFADETRKLYGVQWHPEVRDCVFGQKMLENFLYRCANIVPTWTSESFVEQQIEFLREKIGSQKVICGLSGGVDSAVAAALVHKAVGDQLTCIFVDHGFLRKGEARQVEYDYVQATGVKLCVAQESERFFAALEGVVDPERKRKVVGAQFIRVFENVATGLVAAKGGDIKYLVQGTLYPDLVESGFAGSAVIKTHHNTGGLPEDLSFDLLEPLRSLFKDEVRAVGFELGLPEKILQRHPFPGPGLSIRIVGEVTKSRVALLQEADAIANEEIDLAGLGAHIWQMPIILLANVHSVGVQGDGRTYGNPVVLRPVSSEDAMTANWFRLPYDVLARISNRITNEVSGVNRVVLDITSKPPGTIEWE